MVSEARPIDRLQALANSGANGELICAASQLEIHVFLQAGRIAWATDSRHRFAFASHLQSHARIDPDTLRQVVEECRRERLPLGETLVEWGLATWDGVRTSLAHQIATAVGQLAALETAQTLFLERAFGTYNERLTFEVGEFVAVEPGPAPAPMAAAGGAAQEPAPAPAPAPTPESAQPGLARQLRGSIEGLSWVEVLEHDRLIEGDPPCPSLRIPLGLVRATVHDGCDFVAIRSARSSVVGLRVTGARSVWCRLSADATFGGAVSAIWSVAGAAERTPEPAPARPELAAWSVGDDAPATEALRTFQQRAREVLGAIVLAADPGEPVAGTGCSLIEPARCVDLARRRASCLRDDTIQVVDPGEHALDSIGFSLKTMVSGEAKLWCFGAALERGGTLWLFLDRRTSQGLGWAYLTAVTRALSRARAVDA